MTPIQRIRVPAGFLFAGVYLYFAQPTLFWWTLGGLIGGLGLAIRVWAAGYLHKWDHLALAGPYRRTRNPLYLGSFLMGVGFGIASAQPWLLGSFVILFGLIYVPVMRREEEELRQAYGQDFESYRGHVPRFFPRPGVVSAESASGPGNFLWERVISNREYQAGIGYLSIMAALLAKMLWL